ncbi:50S ribosomal protein L19 [Candidatus Azambacteria bacterium]|nr:50S ribosomal protein L19 [Candidatus Azambacteria bacterium]
MNSLKKFTEKNLEIRKFDFKVGDEIAVSSKLKEGDKTKVGVFEGLVLKRNHGEEPGATFTVRKLFGAISVERIFPLHSPIIDNIKVLKSHKVRRAKLYYLRDATGKKAKLKLIKTKA